MVGFVGDEEELQHKQIDGIKVLGDHNHLEVLARFYHIQELCVAMPNIPPGQSDRVQELCQRMNITLLCYLPRTVKENVPSEFLEEAQTGEPAFAAV